jgi:hypothetical protein
MIIMNKKVHYLYLPNVEKIARELVDTSQIMLIVKHALKIPLINLAKLFINNIVYLPKLAKKDYAVGVKLLCELELLSHDSKEEWILHPQMTDMALALNNFRVIKEFVKLGATYHFKPAVATNNPERLVLWLADYHNIHNRLKVYFYREIDAQYYEVMQQSQIEWIIIK